MDITKTAPVLFLGISTWLSGGKKLLPVALLLSAAGDLAGEEHSFLMQISLFALAHIAYIFHFGARAGFSRRKAIYIAIWAVCLLLIGGYIISHIDTVVIKVACSVYMLLIGTMVATTFTIRSAYRWLYIASAMLFLFSDSCIAWNKFVEHFAHAGVIIMSTYFAAQGIFAWLYLKKE